MPNLVVRLIILVMLETSGVSFCYAEDRPCPVFMPDCRWDAFVRYRFEDVNEYPSPNQKIEGEAHTTRIAAGLDSGTFKGFGLYGQIEYVGSINGKDYSDGGVNGVNPAQRATILDAEGFEIKQGNIRFDGREFHNAPILNASLLRLGQQEIKHRADPFQRFLGNVGFRQHFQTYDAARVTNRSVRDLVIDYAYIWNVNTFFGDRNRTKGNRGLAGHAINFLYDGDYLRDPAGRQRGTLEAYSYLLDFDETENAQLSSQTYGLRLDTKRPNPLGLSRTEFVGNFESALQIGYRSNPQRSVHGYFHSELGLNYFPMEKDLPKDLPMALSPDSIGVLFGYELLGGSGANVDCLEAGFCAPAAAFQTPLGTNHAFLGANDRFAAQTPRDGVHDRYVTLKSQFAPWNSTLTIQGSYHDFESDHDNYRYGREWVISAEWFPFSDNSGIWEQCRNNSKLLRMTLSRNLLVGVQYAIYQADPNVENARNNSLKLNQDVEKIWAFVQWKLDY